MRTNEINAGLSQRMAIDATSWHRVQPDPAFRPGYSRAVIWISLFQAALLAYLGWQYSPTVDEPAHLAAGVACWTLGRFDVYTTNPPLVKITAAAPVVLMRPDTDWKGLSSAALSHRTEWEVGKDFLHANVNRWRVMIAVSRWACIPFVLLGGTICYRWARGLYGARAGLLALCLWATSPTVLAWGATITPDVASAALGSLAGYWYWRWISSFTWWRAALVGLATGLAVLAKITWVILFVLWPVLFVLTCWLTRSRASPQTDHRRDRGRGHPGVPLKWRGAQLGAIGLLALYVLNTGYGWEDSFAPLRTYTFLSRPLAGKQALIEKGNGGNRFAGSALADVPVPFPKAFVQGADLQKYDFELTKRSFLNGVWKSGGWWYYYFEALLLKEPPGIWILAICAAGTVLATYFRCGRRGLHRIDWEDTDALMVASSSPARPGSEVDMPVRNLEGALVASRSCPQPFWAGWKHELILAAPAIAVFGLVSTETGFSRYLRYMLPIYPFLFIWISRCANLTARRPGELLAQGWHRSTFFGTIVCLALCWNVVSSLCVYPHSMSYFTDCIGGPRHGFKYLGDANIGCGQDLHYLSRWHEAHSAARPLTATLSFNVSPSLLGLEIESREPPAGRAAGDPIGEDFKDSNYGPHPGWYALSVDMLQDPDYGYQYFRDFFEPAARAGYSISIYYISPEAANAARSRIGLAPLVDDEGLQGSGRHSDPSP